MEEHNVAVIENLFEELRDIGAVTSTVDFSVEWLGMQHSYLRCLRARNKRPSTKAWANLAVKLRHASQSLAQNKQPKVRRTSKYLAKMSDRCLEEIIAAGERTICVLEK